MIPNRVAFAWRVMTLLARGRVVPAASVEEDYDRLSGGYDDYFTARVAGRSQELIERLDLKPGMRVLDLACGTGTLSLAAARAVGPAGAVVGVDRSAGMLREAARKTRGLGNVRFVQSDLLQELGRLPEASFDAACCGWAIGYANPPALLRAIRARLKPGGAVGIIENARDTLAPIRATALRVAMALPRHCRQLMDLHFRLPRNEAHLRRLFAGAGLRPLRSWHGEVESRFANGREALDWVLHTGASAGFDRMMDPSAKAQCDRLFVEFIERDFRRDGAIRVAHRYVAGIARKEP